MLKSLAKAVDELGNDLMLAKLTHEMQHLESEEVEDAKVLYVLLRKHKDAMEMIRKLRERKEELDDEPEEAETQRQIALKETELERLRNTLAEIRTKLNQEDTL
ncbi:hypothetical protein CEE36_08800 [candidate division TA06 bacterium B3_TA06]|uniref:Uncharacterized protein n=1 Tax=candidate division TA06 bacterium B3_TA06 TaxID=2012487 RepID=A0A532V166_UNCT6|nr:MAG: hypothetical protein CEE36_08800 [candidate division TA06 bacterium B3_TA06]